jgi:regulator of sigma E protease
MNVLPTSTDFLSRIAEWAQTIPGGSTAFTIALFILVLSILIFVHEWGHYLAARSVGIKVETFAIGFGRRIAGWVDKNGTRWQVGWIPFGGYVQMLGQEDGAAYSHADDPESFAAKTVWQRAWVIVAGPLANLVFGFLLLVVIMLTGEHRLKAEVGSIMPNMPAAGVLMEKDVVTAIDGVAIPDWDTFQKTVSVAADKPLAFSLLRNGQPVNVTLTPKMKTFKDLLGTTHHAALVGITPSYDTFVVQHGPVGAVARAASRTWEITSFTVVSMGKLLIGAIPADNLTGPMGIANMTGQTAASGMSALMMFMVVITINLCIVNLFPIPILDGGHLVFLAYEKLTGKPLKDRVQEWMLRAGLACIICLALFSTFNDLKHMGFIKSSASPTHAQPDGTPVLE